MRKNNNINIHISLLETLVVLDRKGLNDC